MVTLKNEKFSAVVDPIGGWLTHFSDDNGAILYPKTMLKDESGDEKIRGGNHVCLPNFGPGGESDLAQHGFGRTATWEVLEAEQSQVRLTLEGGAAGYEGLISELHYTLRQDGISMRLIVMNVGNEPLAIAPAFHPYFALPEGEDTVLVNDETLTLSDLHEMKLVDGESRHLLAGHRNIHLESRNLPTWAHWTDELGKYVCVEPTMAGYAFENNTQRLLQAGELAEFDLNIAIL